MGVYLSTPKTEKTSTDGEDDRLRFGVSSMQGWRSTMEDDMTRLPRGTHRGITPASPVLGFIQMTRLPRGTHRGITPASPVLGFIQHAAHLNLDDSTAFFGVYDGHGGKAVSKFCAKYLHQQVLKQEAYSAGDLGTSLRKAFLRMDEMMCGQRGWRELAILGDRVDQFNGMIEGLIWSKSGEDKGQLDDWDSEEGSHSDFTGPSCGSTACVAIIRNNQIVVANAGDSRCVISRNGQAYNLSKDHKPDLEVEKERIYKAGGYIQCGRVNGTLNLSRAIGDMELKRDNSRPAEEQILSANPDIRTVDLDDDDDFLVIACDGIWDCMSSQQLVDFVRKQLDSENKLSTVIEKVFDRCIAPTAGGEGCDNMTMILVQFKKPPSSTASTKDHQPLSPNQQSEVADKSSGIEQSSSTPAPP